MIACVLWLHKNHTKCLTEQYTDFDGKSYRCEKCRQIPDNITALVTMTSALLKEFGKLQNQVKTVNENQMKVSKQLSDIKEQNDCTTQDNVVLRTEITQLRAEISAKHWSKKDKPKQTIVIGSSLVKHMDESKIQNTKVMCKPGGKVKDIAEQVKALPSDVKYDKLVLLAGGNDISENNDLESSKTQYKSLVRDAKTKFNHIVVSAIPPRMKPAEFTEKAAQFNAELQVIAAENECEYVDHSGAFYLNGGQINDGYFDNDGIHPNLRGTNQIGKALGLEGKNTATYDIATKNAGKKHPTQKLTQNIDDIDQFQHAFWQKAKAKSSKGAQRQKQETYNCESTSQHTDSHTVWNKHSQQEHNFHTRQGNDRCDYCAEHTHATRDCGFRGYVRCFTCNEQGHKNKFCNEFTRYAHY